MKTHPAYTHCMQTATVIQVAISTPRTGWVSFLLKLAWISDLVKKVIPKQGWSLPRI